MNLLCLKSCSESHYRFFLVMAVLVLVQISAESKYEECVMHHYPILATSSLLKCDGCESCIARRNINEEECIVCDSAAAASLSGLESCFCGRCSVRPRRSLAATRGADGLIAASACTAIGTLATPH